MPEDLEKGNSLIVRFFFSSEGHCDLFLFKFLSHFLICINVPQPPVLRVYNLQICTAASTAICFHLSYLYPIMIKNSSTLESKCKCFLKHLQFSCKVFPPAWWFEYGPVYLEQKNIVSLLSFIWQRWEWMEEGYEFKAWCSCSWSSYLYKQFYSQGTMACCCLKEDGFILSALLCSWPGGLLPSLLPVPALVLLQPSSDLLISPNCQKNLPSLLFSVPWVCFLQHLWVTVQVVRRR